MYIFKSKDCEHCGRRLPVFDPATMERVHYDWKKGIEEHWLYVELLMDPFNSDINGDYSLHWLCQQCEQLSAMEV